MNDKDNKLIWEAHQSPAVYSWQKNNEVDISGLDVKETDQPGVWVIEMSDWHLASAKQHGIDLDILKVGDSVSWQEYPNGLAVYRGSITSKTPEQIVVTELDSE